MSSGENNKTRRQPLFLTLDLIDYICLYLQSLKFLPFLPFNVKGCNQNIQVSYFSIQVKTSYIKHIQFCQVQIIISLRVCIMQEREQLFTYNICQHIKKMARNQIDGQIFRLNTMKLNFQHIQSEDKQIKRNSPGNSFFFKKKDKKLTESTDEIKETTHITRAIVQ